MKKLSFIFAVLLAGCGGSGRGSIDAGATMPPLPEQVPTDPFFAQVLTVVAATPDDTEASGIDTLAAASAPDGSEATAL